MPFKIPVVVVCDKCKAEVQGVIEVERFDRNGNEVSFCDAVYPLDWSVRMEHAATGTRIRIACPACKASS